MHSQEYGKRGLPIDDNLCRQHVQSGMETYFQLNHLPYTSSQPSAEEQAHEFLRQSRVFAKKASLREIILGYHNEDHFKLPNDNQSCRRIVEAGMEIYFEGQK